MKVFFSHPKAALPVLLEDGSVYSVRWGRRDDESVALPQGGWARQTSIDAGKWKPSFQRYVKIAVDAFQAKDTAGIMRWFKLDRGSYLQGIITQSADPKDRREQRVYIVVAEGESLLPKLVRENGEPGLAEPLAIGHERRGRASNENPASRFEKHDIEFDPSEPEAIRTQVLWDSSRTILVRNDSPDVGFGLSVNPYRGCEHGCIYCYARPTHEYFGMSPGLDFETKIIAKKNAAALLREELSSPRYKPEVIAMSGVTDLYQPIERKLRITRACLEVLAEFRNPLGIVTKNQLVTRDIDLLQELARFDAACVMVSLTTLDEDLAAKMEPRASRPRARLAAIEALAQAGIPVGVMTAPIIPGLTDHEIPELLKAAVDAGARFAGRTVVRLPYGVKDLFDSWLTTHFPERKTKILSRIVSIRDGKMNDSQFGTRMSGQGEWAKQIEQIHDLTAQRLGISGNSPHLTTAHFRRVQNAGQMFLWD